MLPNDGAVQFGKAERVQQLPIPEWARANFSTAVPVVSNPLNTFAGSVMLAEGTRTVLRAKGYPWERGKIRRAAYTAAMGRAAMYQPLTVGRRYA